eukprot:CAMPEP_0117497564 /NCGR_PEP_ID=MMETSP0784-20121206/21247_1 /TAXON_ID=39447 /ORGANISM="" /LENGTH=119 /DNA_ID=CAMNT_0005292589 /DNA_START=256 /DNA_END=614 /DNA_ORIENTATION=-
MYVLAPAALFATVLTCGQDIDGRNLYVETRLGSAEVNDSVNVPLRIEEKVRLFDPVHCVPLLAGLVVASADFAEANRRVRCVAPPAILDEIGQRSLPRDAGDANAAARGHRDYFRDKAE